MRDGRPTSWESAIKLVHRSEYRLDDEFVKGCSAPLGALISESLSQFDTIVSLLGLEISHV